MSIDEGRKTFSFISSLGDKKVFSFRENANDKNSIGEWYDQETNLPVDNSWYKKVLVDYELMFKVKAVLGELILEKKFVNAISEIKIREINKVIKEKALALRSSKKVSSSVLNNECNEFCQSSTVYYAFWRTDACSSAYNDLASNRYCIGDCGPRSCDCASVSGDFGVICRAFSKACTSGPGGSE